MNVPERNMTAPVVSVVIPIRNRSGVRLDNCLRALRWQDFKAPLEIVITDFGSNAQHAADLERLRQLYELNIVRVETDETWNRSRALNHGIQQSRGRYIFCTDADMIFAPNFVATLVKAQQESKQRAIAVCHCRDLPEEVPEQPWTLQDFGGLLAKAPYRDKLGTGACQMAVREFFESVRGYDERYVFWGMEDNDMLFRAQRWGLEVTWVHEQTSMLHQWHPSDRGKRPVRKFLNDARFHLTKYRLVKNRSGWGARS